MMGRRSCSVKQQKVRKGLWSPEEDDKLFNHITRFGVGCWSSVPNLAGLERCGKSCRLRWINYLRPDLKRGMFSQQEEDLIIRLHEVLGNKWAQISLQLPGRTDNEIKNFWNSSLKKKLMKQGIDPNTHKPITDIKDGENFMTSSTPMHILSTTIEEQSYHHLDSTDEGLMQTSRNDFSSKQAYDHPTLFLSEFQSSIDPSDLLKHCQQNLTRPPINLGYGFNSMPNLKIFDHQNMMDPDYSDSSASKFSAFFMSDAKESSSNSSNVNSHTGIQINSTVENPSALFWDAEDKLESVYQFQFSGTQNQEAKTTPLEQIHNQNSEDYRNFQALTESSLDVFQQL